MQPVKGSLQLLDPFAVALQIPLLPGKSVFNDGHFSGHGFELLRDLADAAVRSEQGDAEVSFKVDKCGPDPGVLIGCQPPLALDGLLQVDEGRRPDNGVIGLQRGANLWQQGDDGAADTDGNGRDDRRQLAASQLHGLVCGVGDIRPKPQAGDSNDEGAAHVRAYPVCHRMSTQCLDGGAASAVGYLVGMKQKLRKALATACIILALSLAVVAAVAYEDKPETED